MNAILYIDLLGTFAFAISGVMTAVEKKFDFFGAIILAFVTAVGGGTLRDILIGAKPVGWLESDWHIWIVLSALPISYLFFRWLKRLRKTLLLFDTIGIGLFTILGIQKALAFELSPIVAIMMGVISAVFGGILRDVLANEIPLIFRKEVYAFACLSGAVVYLGLSYISQFELINMIVAIATVLTIRILALLRKWSIPFNPR
ncbi:MAG: trimeric intracellular cation channel family protein [Crocinitomicaceae bacterium]|nr:trimeric intracellular cation channel family protein [Crocinitomicaceae bacterium]